MKSYSYRAAHTPLASLRCCSSCKGFENMLHHMWSLISERKESGKHTIECTRRHRRRPGRAGTRFQTCRSTDTLLAPRSCHRDPRPTAPDIDTQLHRVKSVVSPCRTQSDMRTTASLTFADRRFSAGVRLRDVQTGARTSAAFNYFSRCRAV